jgi:hypothetical protein
MTFHDPAGGELIKSAVFFAGYAKYSSAGTPAFPGLISASSRFGFVRRHFVRVPASASRHRQLRDKRASFSGQYIVNPFLDGDQFGEQSWRRSMVAIARRLAHLEWQFFAIRPS